MKAGLRQGSPESLVAGCPDGQQPQLVHFLSREPNAVAEMKANSAA